uniref:Ribosomal protein S3 n=1 Tax=Choreocolax polysiphoniae TaxID=282351 RepID=A0A1J0F7C3_9FLOR|nr:ribosomal protein S3 [Choreocolax polysiphoniae]APC24869.1 ribosomal protein S3 [Choreocolax polysiphoniae]
MTKKINLNSKYLGLSIKCFLNFQNYGNINSLFSKYFINLFIFYIILKKYLLLIQNNFFSFIELFISNNFLKLNINLSHTNLFKLKIFINILSKLEKILILNFSLLKLKTLVYFEKKNFFSIIFVKNYINYLILKMNYFPKKIFNFLIILFKTMLNKQKISFSNKGTKIIKLNGIKIQLKGRYDLTKNSMSKILLFKYGKINSVSLNKKIEFLNKVIYTKLGKSSFKIWFFYTFYKG